jgi:hypothetical protein
MIASEEAEWRAGYIPASGARAASALGGHVWPGAWSGCRLPPRTRAVREGGRWAAARGSLFAFFTWR